MNNSLQPSYSSQQLEPQTWLSPLGLRFWDELDGRIVSDGLSITAYPSAQIAQSPRYVQGVQAFTNRSGVYVLRNLPGLRDFERGTGAAQFLSGVVDAAAQTYPFTLEVIDTLGRFQPFSLSVVLPMRGLYTWTCERATTSVAPTSGISEITATPVPLFSAPTRGVGSGLAVIRATLWDAVTNLPAAWAVLEASIAGRRIARGFADSNGQVALFFPSPSPVGPTFDPSGPPLPGGTNTALTAQTWSVQLQSYYSPGQGSLGSPPSPPSGASLQLPDLCATLQQAPATLWTDAVRTAPLTEATLRFGQELVVRSSNTTPQSVLLISQAV